MAIGQSNKPNFNVQAPVANQSLVFDTNQQAFVNANISSTGSITGASNVGAGQGNVFKQLSGTDLQFKTLVQGTNVTIADGTDAITISANGVVTTAENLGSGTGLFAQLDSGTGKVQFKGLVAGTGIALANNSTDVTVSIDASTVDAATLGGNAASVFLTKADNLASVGSLSTARDNLSVYSKAEGDARYFKQGADVLPDADNTRSLGNNSNRFSDIYAVDIHGTVTTAGQVTSLANQDIGNLRDVDTTGVASNSILKWDGTKWAIAVDAGGITTLNALTDVDTTGAVNSSVLKYNASSGQWEIGSDVSGGGGGASTFVGLTDTPNNFVGAGSKFVKVNSGGNALEFTTVDTDGIAEGTNLYFTNARADARIGAANISDLANVHTAAPTDGQVLKWDNANSRWAPAADNDTVYSTFNSDFDTRLATKSTTNLTEGTNLYYTDARADARIAAATTDDLTEGSSNLYFTQARARASISEGSAQLSYNSGTGVLTFTQGNTDTVAEGSSNLYYTSARANADFDTRLATKDTGDLAEGTNLYYTNARADARIANNILDEDNFASNSATNTASQQSIKAYVDAQVASENELSEMNDVTISAVGNNHFIKYNASTSKWENASVAPATAAGNDTEVQFNDGGLMGSDPGMVYNKTTNDLTVSGKILYSNVYSAEGDLPSAATYHGMFAHVHGTGKGYFAHGGAWRKLLDESSSTTTNLTEGTNLYYTDARFDTRLASKDTGDLTEGSNLYYTDARARAAISEGSAQLSYNSSTGVLTFTQDDTDGIAEGSTNLYFTNARADARIAAASINALSDVDTSGASNGKILKYNGSTWVVADDTDTDTGILNVVEDTTPQLGGTLDANGNTIDMGTNVITDAKVGQWDTAYGWGDHGSAGYLTSVPAQSFASLTGKPTTIAGYGITDAFDNTDFDTRLATKDTDDVAEGSTNLYYTDARADTRATLRIGAANLSALNDVNNATPTDGQVLTWDNSNSYWKPATASGGGGTFGLAGNTGTHTFNTATETLTFLGTTGQINAGIASNNVTLELDPNINSIQSISFEGTTADNNETKLQAVDPTADRTINLPDASGHLAVFATASPAAITDGTNGQALVTDGNGQLSFTTITSGSSLTVQDEGSSLSTAATTLNFVGAGVTASGTGATKTITIAGGGGSGGTEYEEFKINYATNGQISSISDTSSGISSVNIDSAAGGDLTVNFTGYTTPPLSFVMYGYQYSQNKYVYNTVASGNMTLREVPGGGSSGSPTAFGSFSSMKIRCSESETGAGRSFGTTTHAWVRFVMGA